MVIEVSTDKTSVIDFKEYNNNCLIQIGDVYIEASEAQVRELYELMKEQFEAA